MAELPDDHGDPRVLLLARDGLERLIERQELNRVVSPAVGGDRLFPVVFLDGESAAVLARAERRELHEHDTPPARPPHTGGAGTMSLHGCVQRELPLLVGCRRRRRG